MRQHETSFSEMHKGLTWQIFIGLKSSDLLVTFLGKTNRGPRHFIEEVARHSVKVEGNIQSFLPCDPY